MTNVEIARRFLLEQDRLKGASSSELCAVGFTASINSLPPLDYEGHDNFAIAFYNGFPDVGHTIEEVVANDEKTVVRFGPRGSHCGEFMGIPASGMPIDVQAIAILDIADGKVAAFAGGL